MNRIILLAICLVLLVASPSMSQPWNHRGHGGHGGYDRPWENRGSVGNVKVVNNWRGDVTVSMTTPERNSLGGSWNFSPGEEAFLAIDGDRVVASGKYRIKVDQEGRSISLRRVGEFENGVWVVYVRNVWRAQQD